MDVHTFCLGDLTNIKTIPSCLGKKYHYHSKVTIVDFEHAFAGWEWSIP